MAVRERELAELPRGIDPPRGRLAALWDRLAGPFRRGAAPPPRPATGFYTDTTVCIGCKACEVACKQWNQLPADGFNWTGNSYDNTGELSATSWRHVKFIEQFTPALPSNGERPGTRVALDLVPSAPPHPTLSPPGGEGRVRGENRWLMMS